MRYQNIDIDALRVQRRALNDTMAASGALPPGTVDAVDDLARWLDSILDARERDAGEITLRLFGS
jgi:hypothetical protein